MRMSCRGITSAQFSFQNFRPEYMQYEELLPVRSRPGVRHRQDSGPGVLLDEILVGELGAVDLLSACAIPGGEVSTLAHEFRDNAVEGGALVVEGPPALPSAFLAGAEGTEVLGRVRHRVCVQLHHDTADWDEC
ncbi:hypothetical protein MRB53_001121 [Persea americana]|uniref:Uncharacterized protein n=1 Tax=Persea americana TaxID=3435 RepID=A0ACC2MR47_PERAE|nr:hypothetical protein MRB53_001121 [Persea americana]